METKVWINKKIFRIVLTLAAILLLKGLFSWSNQFSSFYFDRWYNWSSLVFRQITGIVPFSIGDVIYTAWVIGAIVYLLKLCYKLITFAWEGVFEILLRALHFLLRTYLAFLILWGFNYERSSPAKDVGLVVQPSYNTQQLYHLTDTLLSLVNKGKLQTGDTLNALSPDPDKNVFKRAIVAYKAAAETWPAFRYKAPSIKRSIYGKWLNYTGVTGYLNPFTNEAQVNLTVPPVLHPFISCHEIAHQLGYAPEETANFVGYLAATSTSDTRFRYSANFDMFLYSIRQLSYRDTALAKEIWRRALPGVKADYKSIIEFYEPYTGKVDEYSTMLYDRYLKANNQEKGIRSYSEVTGWLIAYFHL
ncbi:DUF3810 domain-containing protein [Chitinophaga silvatica]|uniref:DUF3810 domain-containing protein n=1 Tax=Chitinophaga silvatica TaxID=2282649 RepID=A0A3E1Y6V3_9BACT|nr:DUF3810 domain-containing protein [Chitinophaga silvatica]RFS20631.1 DUF3810 domain-containing protein [Chitinophaga silvatica]